MLARYTAENRSCSKKITSETKLSKGSAVTALNASHGLLVGPTHSSPLSIETVKILYDNRARITEHKVLRASCSLRPLEALESTYADGLYVLGGCNFTQRRVALRTVLDERAVGQNAFHRGRRPSQRESRICAKAFCGDIVDGRVKAGARNPTQRMAHDVDSVFSRDHVCDLHNHRHFVDLRAVDRNQ